MVDTIHTNGVEKLLQHKGKAPTDSDILSEAEKLLSQMDNENESHGIFNVRSANKVLSDAKNQPDPINLFDRFIIQDETTLIFADTGAGKSVFAMQAADAISRNHIVLIADLEQSDKQFQKRYSDENGFPYAFSENLYRVGYSRDFEIPRGIEYTDFFIQSLISASKSVDAKIIFIDNLTKLAAGDTDTAKDSIRIMEKLHRLKIDHGMTIVAIEHNKKVLEWQPISLNHLQGSKMKPNFADAIISIGRSQKDKYIRYVKQLKVRSADLIYDTENVSEYEIVHEKGFLHFKHTGFGPERDHLKPPGENSHKEMFVAAKDMRINGKSNVEIARILNVSESTIRNWFKNSQTSQTSQKE